MKKKNNAPSVRRANTNKGLREQVKTYCGRLFGGEVLLLSGKSDAQKKKKKKTMAVTQDSQGRRWNGAANKPGQDGASDEKHANVFPN